MTPSCVSYLVNVFPKLSETCIDSVASAATLEKLLLDASLAARMGAAARRRTQENFSVRRQVDRLLALWSALLARGFVP